MAPVSVHSLGCSSFGVSVTCQPYLFQQQNHPSLLSLLLWPPAPGWVPCATGVTCAQGVAEPWAEKQQLQQRALFVKMKPVCASVPVSRLACPAALS